ALLRGGSAWTVATNDLTYFGVNMLVTQAAVLNQRIERAAPAALSPVIDDALFGGGYGGGVDGHNPAQRHKEGTGVQPSVLDQDPWPLQPGRFHDDVGIAAGGLDAVDCHGPELELAGYFIGELLACFVSLARNTNLLQIELAGESGEIAEGRAA